MSVLNAFRPAAFALAAVLLSAPLAGAAQAPGYKALEFTQYSTQSGFVFGLPATDTPVRIDISLRLDGKPVGSSMVMSALVTQDQYGARTISWVGTDSDGVVSSGNTASGDRILARIRAKGQGNYAVLQVADLKKGRLKVIQKDAASGSKGAYAIRIWY